MEEVKLHVLAKISLLFVLYLLTYFTFFAFVTKPAEGDSLAYHIPIAKIILHGSVLNPKAYTNILTDPGASEVILSGFMAAGLPLNLYNVVALFLLLLVTISLALTFGLSKPYAVIFAATICTLHTVVRWISTQSIDIWLAAFFVLTLLLLQKPEKKFSYFVKLGFSAGMLVGSKYTGPLFLLVLSLFYTKSLIKNISFQRFLAFLIPFTLFGLFWYIRNYVFWHDPYYPQPIPFFKGIPGWSILDKQPWKIILFYKGGLTGTLNAFFSEYGVWSLALPVALVLIVYGYKKIHQVKYALATKLFIIGVLNLVIYLFLPDGPYFNLYVSTLRYTYPALIPLILSLFLIAKEFHREEVVSAIAILNMLMPTEFGLQYGFHPKILLAFIPIGLLVYFINFDKPWRFFPLRLPIF